MFLSNLRTLLNGDLSFQLSKLLMQNKDVGYGPKRSSSKSKRETMILLKNPLVKKLENVQKFSLWNYNLVENICYRPFNSLSSLVETKYIDARKSKNCIKNKQIYTSNQKKKFSTVLKYAKLMTIGETLQTTNKSCVKYLMQMLNKANNNSNRNKPSSAESNSSNCKYTLLKKEKEIHNRHISPSKLQRKCFCTGTPPQKPTGGDGDGEMPSGVMLHKNTECMLNNQISAELFASYAYFALASYFGRNDIGLNGFYNFFMAMSEEETGHAVKLMDYVNLRGGNVSFCPLPAPSLEVKGAKTALEIALGLELDVTCKLVGVHDEAAKYNDYVTMDFIVTEYLQDQYKSMQEIQVFISKINIGGPCGVAILKLDKMLEKKFKRPSKSTA